MTLKMLRARENLTQKEVAKLIGVTQKTWGNWEKGTTSPTVEKVQEIEKLFNVSYDDINFLPQITVKT
ncbi:helix-turn-helix transcriptional regulator [Streptococcus sp. ZJ100]|uniref:helix-turn-helix transcriptional regulator n=1 Tax=Streptococcus handemini TaxID=3161188 RepID=UPI0032F08F01